MMKYFKFMISKLKGFMQAICFQLVLNFYIRPVSSLHSLVSNAWNLLQVGLGLALLVNFLQIDNLWNILFRGFGLCLTFYALSKIIKLNGNLLGPDHKYNTVKEDIISNIEPGIGTMVVKLSRGSIYHSPAFNEWLSHSADWSLDHALLKTSPGTPTPRRKIARKRIGNVSISVIGLLMKPVLSGTKFYNTSLVGLQSDPFDGFNPEHAPVFEPTSYFEYYLTNRLCTQIYRPKKQHEKDVNFFDLYPVSENRLLPLGSMVNNTANVIGVSTIVITKDQMLLSWFQGESNQSSAGLITPTGSGSSDWSDLKEFHKIDPPMPFTFKNILKKGMLRELKEETTCCSTTDQNCRTKHKNLDLSAHCFKSTMLLGAYRWLEHGAKPDFVGITRLDMEGTNRQLCPDNDEVVFSFKTKKMIKSPLDIHIGHIRSVADFPRVTSVIEEHIGQYGSQMSVPMEYAYRQILNYLNAAYSLLLKGQNLPANLQSFLSILDPGFFVG